MSWSKLLFAVVTVNTLARTARADDQLPPDPKSITSVVRRASRQNRTVHADYGALSAGLILFGFGYALALSVPIRRNFDDNTHLAVPVIGPWMSNPSWAWALDGLVQLGGAAFMIDAYANPIVMLGTPRAQLQAPVSAGAHLLRMAIRF